MRCRTWVAPVVIALVATSALADGPAAPPRPSLDGARHAAGRAPLAAVERALASPDRAVRLAAIGGAPAVAEPAEVLDELAAAAAGWDRGVALAAVRAARAIARRLAGHDRATDRGEPLAVDDDALAAQVDAFRALATRGDRGADLRVLALETVVLLTEARARAGEVPPPYDLAALLADGDPEVRRAALELVPSPALAEARPLLVARLTSDAAVAVRVAAGAALCADLPRDAAALNAALGVDGRAAVRTLVTSAPAGGATIELARCLADDAEPAAARALEQLRHRLRPGLRPVLAAALVGARPATR